MIVDDAKSESLGEYVVVDKSNSIVVRPQKGNVLFYNSRSDELHLVSLTGCYIYQLCDGQFTIGDLEWLLSQATGKSPEDVRPQLKLFVSQMIERGILQVKNGIHKGR